MTSTGHDESLAPNGLVLDRTTVGFDEHGVPAGRPRDQVVAPGVRGRLVVRSGRLRVSVGDAAEFEGGAGSRS